MNPRRIKIRRRTGWALLVCLFSALVVGAPDSLAAPIGDGHSYYTSVSADGRYVAFNSGATNLVPNDRNAKGDVFVRDRFSELTTRVTIGMNAGEANGRSYAPWLSADGRYVTFISYASNLVAGDTNNQRDVFVYDRETRETTRVNVSSSGAQSADPSNGDDTWVDSPSISADGRYVAFQSEASGLAPGDTGYGSDDVFLHDRVARTTVLVTASSGIRPSISGDGRYVAYDTSMAVTGNDTNGSSDVYVWDRLSGQTVPASVGASGFPGGGTYPTLSSSGQHVAFRSLFALVANDTNGLQDIYVRNMATGVTTAASLDSSEIFSNGDSFLPAISPDGNRVVFGSRASNLVGGDLNNSTDVFLRDYSTGVTSRVSVHSEGAEGNFHSGEDHSGGCCPSDDVRSAIGDESIVFVSQATTLVGADDNSRQDIFAHDIYSSLTEIASVASEDGDTAEQKEELDRRQEAIFDAISPVDEAAPPTAIYDSPACPGEWFHPQDGTCSSPTSYRVGDVDPTELVTDAFRVSARGACKEGSGKRYRVIYAHIKGEPNRFLRLKRKLRDAAKEADRMLWESARETGVSRHIRFACDRDDAIKVSYMKLRRVAKRDYESAQEQMQTEKIYDVDKRYLLFADWSDSKNPLPDNRFVCGEGGYFVHRNPSKNNFNNDANRVAISNLKPDNPCGSSLAVSALHEITHTLGAVQRGSPNHRNGHVLDLNDIMSHQDGTEVPACQDELYKFRLDCRDDDYFNTTVDLPARGTWLADKQEHETGICQEDPTNDPKDRDCAWNIAWSRWLVGGGN